MSVSESLPLFAEEIKELELLSNLLGGGANDLDAEAVDALPLVWEENNLCCNSGNCFV